MPSPEGVYVNESVNSSTIEWSPPYSAKNNDTIRVDPHITQYTVYITDNHTGNSIDRVNVTKTQFTFNTQDDSLCPMYQVSAWNAGGEGKLSEPIQESTPQGILNYLPKNTCITEYRSIKIALYFLTQHMQECSKKKISDSIATLV